MIHLELLCRAAAHGAHDTSHHRVMGLCMYHVRGGGGVLDIYKEQMYQIT